MTHCLAVLRTYWGGSHPPPMSSPCPLPPQPVSPSPKRFSGPFPLCPPAGEAGRGQQLLLSTAFGRTRSLHPDSACWEAGGPWPLSARLRGRITPCHPPKKQEVLLALVHRAATMPLTLPWVQLSPRGGHVLASLLAYCPHLGVVFCRGSAASGLSPWAQMPSMCLGTPCLCALFTLQGLCVEEALYSPPPTSFSSHFGGGGGLSPSPVTLCHWEPL